jgi:diacylglycerol kinase (ATP)
MQLCFLFLQLQDSQGILVANIRSYMGGVDLWKNEDDASDTYLPQFMHDKKLEVVSFTGMLHLGRLQVWKSTSSFWTVRR